MKGHAGGQIAILHSPPGRLTVAAGPAKAWGRAYFLFVLYLRWSSALPIRGAPAGPDVLQHNTNIAAPLQPSDPTHAARWEPCK